MNLNCIAIDDEPLALRKLEYYILKTPFLSLVKCCKDAFEAMQVMKENKVELVFADINMPDLSGMDFVKMLHPDKPQIIFTTAYSEYAVEGFKVDATDYLLKPYGYVDFLRASTKALRQAELKVAASKNAQESKEDEESIFIKCDYKTRRLFLRDVTYIEGESEYVRIHTSDGKSILYLSSMRAILETLSSPRFIRVHRSFIVNSDRIKEMSKSKIFLIVSDGDNVQIKDIPIGDQFRDELKKWQEQK